MTYCFYIFICLGLITLQTTILPCFQAFGGCYDLLIPFILYLGIYRPAYEGIFAIFLLGFIMDNLSAGPFGLYGTAYLWVFISAKWMVKFLHVANRVLLPLVAILGVLIENIIFFGTFMLLGTGSRLSPEAARTVAFQMLWALCTGAFLLVFFDSVHKKWEQWIEEQFSKESGD